MRGRRVWATLAAAGLALAAAGCGDDAGDGDTGDQVDVSDDGGASDEAPDDSDGEDGDGDGAASGSTAATCEEIQQATLDLVAPGLEPEDIGTPVDLAELSCAWDSEHLFLQLSHYDGAQFWPAPLYQDEDTIDVDLCDEAFVVADFGLDLHVLDGEQVWTVGASQAGTPQDQRLSVEEGIDRLTAFAEAVIAC